MNVGQILETHLGWVAKMLGFYAKTPVFQGANEREIGAAAEDGGRDRGPAQALALRTPAPAISDKDSRRRCSPTSSRTWHGEGDVFDAHQDATINDLGGRTMSQETRDIFHSIRDLPRRPRRRSWPSVSTTATANQIDVPHGVGRRRNDSRRRKKAEYKAALKQLEKREATGRRRSC